VNLKQGKGVPKLQRKEKSQGGATQENPPKPQGRKKILKENKDMGKWCELHKRSTHNTSECWAKQPLVAELKDSISDTCSNYESEPDKGNFYLNDEWSMSAII